MNFIAFIEKIEASLDEALPFVAYRKPNKNKIKAVFQKGDFLQKTTDFTQKGFVFAPFLSKKDAVLFNFDNCDIFEITFDKNEVSPTKITVQEAAYYDKTKHMELVEKTIAFINSGKAKKVVISRREEIELSSFSVSKIFSELLNNYKTAMVYVWYHPKVGLWMGATPESLLSIRSNNFKTMALAGTQNYNGTKNVSWQPKEMEEQQYVTDYMNENLKDVISNLNISEPYTVKAGNLLHLQTDIHGTVKNKTQLQSLIKGLHPTPAVCGLPKQVAQDFIMANEHYDREFYTGFLGELNVDNQTDLYVNLRCMQVKNKLAMLYVGGGITKDSTAESEWQETIAKSKVIKNILC